MSQQRRAHLLVLAASFLVPSFAAAQDAWTVAVNSTMNPLPIGACAAVRLDIQDPATRDIPRTPAGARVTIADFDVTVTSADGQSVAAYWIDAYHLMACGCQAGTPGTSGLITATYPARTLVQESRVSGVEIKVSGEFALARPQNEVDPAACVTPSVAPNAETTTSATSTTTIVTSPTTIALAPAPIPITSTTITRTTTGAAPTGFRLASSVPIIASLVWDAMPNAASYSIKRTVGTATPIERRTVSATAERNASDTIPDPRDTYIYTLVVTYADGSWGTSPGVEFISPPLKNPTGFTAKDRGQGNVEFQWQAIGGALRYRLDGPGMPGTGFFATGTTASFPKTPAGANSWKLTALYQGNFADYANPSTTSLVVRILPPHPGQWLTKSNGPGSQDNVQMPKSEGFSCWYFFCVYDKVFVPNRLQHPYDPIYATFLGRSLEQDVTTTRDAKPVGLTAWLAVSPTFRLWDTPSQFPIEAVYGNPGDLGVGRRSFCAQVTRTEGLPGVYTVCYAAAHGIAAGEPGFNDSSVITNPGEGQGEDFLLAMVITKEPTGTVFMVFGPTTVLQDASWTVNKYKLSPTVTLDSEGPKYVPHACLSCHGGKYNETTHKVDGASFLPIDPNLQSFASAADKEIQQERIRRINEMIAKSGSAPAVVAYINGLYGNQVSMPGRTAIPDFVPTGWRTQSGFYKSVVRPYCATCHLAAPSSWNFASWSNFKENATLIKVAVCNAHTMPHAELQYKAFWTKDTGPVYTPGLLAAALEVPSCP